VTARRDISDAVSRFLDGLENSPSARTDRRLTYRYMTPLAVAGVIWMVAISQWAAAVLIACLLPFCLYAGLQTEGTILRRAAMRLRGRSRADR
jgi:hypothetical protein